MATTEFLDLEIARNTTRTQTTVVRVRHARWAISANRRDERTVERIMVHVNIYGEPADRHYSAIYIATPALVAELNARHTANDWGAFIRHLTERIGDNIAPADDWPGNALELAASVWAMANTPARTPYGE